MVDFQVRHVHVDQGGKHHSPCFSHYTWLFSYLFPHFATINGDLPMALPAVGVAQLSTLPSGGLHGQTGFHRLHHHVLQRWRKHLEALPEAPGRLIWLGLEGLKVCQ